MGKQPLGGLQINSRVIILNISVAKKVEGTCFQKKGETES